MKTHPYPITDTAELKALCARLASQPHIAIDTEFMRETTYYAKICLIQVASDDEAAAIDPLAKGLDLTPFYDLMKKLAVWPKTDTGRLPLLIMIRKRLTLNLNMKLHSGCRTMA